MPTLREKLDEGLASGIPFDELQAKVKDIGFEHEDLDLDYSEAWKRAEARKAAKKAPTAAPTPAPTPPPAPATPEPGVVGAIKQLRKAAGIPEPVPGSGEAWRERPDVAVDVVPVERPKKPLSVLDIPGMAARGFGEALGTQMQVAEAQRAEQAKARAKAKPVERPVPKSIEEEPTGGEEREFEGNIDESEQPQKPQEWSLEFPTPLSVARRAVAGVSGLAHSITGESEAGKAVDLAAAGVAELLDPFASEQQKKQRARDVYESYLRYKKGGAGTLVQPAGWQEGETEAQFDARMKRLLSEGKYGEVIRGALPAGVVKAYEGMGEQRKAKSVGIPTSAAEVAQAMKNAADDLGSIIGGLASAANDVVGITVEPVHGRREQGAREVGESFSPVTMSGMSANLLRGLASVDENSALTHPFSTWLMVVQPARESMHNLAPVKMAAAEQALGRAIDAVADKMVKTIPGGERARDGIIRAIRDGLYQGDRQLAGELDVQVNGGEASKAFTNVMADKIRNIAGREGVEFEATPVEPHIATLQGAPAKGAPQAAARQAREAAVAQAERTVGAREANLASAERAADMAGARADTAGERMARAEAAVGQREIGAAARNVDMQAAMEEFAKAVYERGEEQVRRRPDFEAKLKDAQERHGEAQFNRRKAESLEEMLGEKIDELRSIIDDNAVETDYTEYHRKAAEAAEAAGAKNAKSLRAKSDRAYATETRYAKKQLEKMERERDRLIGKVVRLADAEDAAAAKIGPAQEAAQARAEKWEATEAERKAAADMDFEARMRAVSERQAKAQEQITAARERHAKANEAYDKANVDHQTAQKEAEKAQNELGEAEATRDALAEKLAAVKGKGKRAANAALEAATAEAERAAVKLKEAVRRANQAQERMLDKYTVASRMDAERRGLEAEDAAAAAKRAVERAEVIRAAGETIPTEPLYGPATEAERALTTGEEPIEELPPPSGLDAQMQAITNRAEQAKQEALLAGYDPNAPVPASLLDPIRKFAPHIKGDTIGEIAQQFAHDVTWQIPDEAKVPGIIQGALENMGVSPEASAPAARFLMAQQEVSRLGRVKEVPFGNIRRPEPVVTDVVLRKGRLEPGWQETKMNQAFAQERAKNIRAFYKKELTKEALDRRQDAFTHLERMASHRIESEAPVPFMTTNPELNALADQVADKVLSVYQPEFAYEGGYRQMAIDLGEAMPAVGETVLQAGEDMKKLSKERLLQRIFEPFQAGSTALLRIPSVRNAYSKRFNAKLIELGYRGKEALDLRQQFNEMINKPEDWNAHSKNRYLEIKDEAGNPIWTREDYIKGLDSIAPNTLNKLKAEAAMMVINSMADSAHGYGVQRMMAQELYAPFRNPDGTYRTEVKGDIGMYCQALAEMVEDRGEMLPFAMPYDGAKVAKNLRSQGRDALAARVEQARFTDAESLKETLTRWHKEQFRSTDLPPDLVNMHVQASVANGLDAHYSMLHGVSIEAPFFRFLHDLIQRSKTMVVAANVGALVNNNVSNLLGQAFKRADPLIPLKTVQAYIADHAWRQGKLTGDLALDFDALATTDLRNSTHVMSELRRQHGNQFTQFLKAKAPDFMRGVDKLDMRMGEVPSTLALAPERLNDLLIQSYQELGDLPSRTECALHYMHEVRHKMDSLAVGSKMRIPVSEARFIEVEKVGDNLFRSKDTLRRDAVVKEFEGGSKEARELQAQYGNLIQSQWFLDFNKVGNYAKRLRTPGLGWLSGIFTWFWQARDIPFIKKGLVARMLETGDGIWTNDPNVLRQQASERFGLAMRKAMLTAAGNNAQTDQANLEELRRAVAFNSSSDAMVLHTATDPAQAYAKDLGPIIFAGPTKSLMRGVQGLAEAVAYSMYFNDDQTIMHLIAPTPEDEALRASMTPAERKELDIRLRGMKRYLAGTTFGWEDFMQSIGASGAPLIKPLFKLSLTPGYTLEKARKDYVAQFYGKTFNSLAQTLGAGLGLAMSSPGLLDVSGYGAPAEVGKRGQVTDDVSDFMQWALANITGMGWRTAQIMEGVNRATGKEMAGAIKNMMRKTHDVVKQRWMQDFDDAVAAAMAAYGEDAKASEEARNLRGRVEMGIKRYFAEFESGLDRQAAALRKKNVD